jgi:cysteine desulfurase
MNRIYLDNAATTPMLPEVITLITNTMNEVYGNPSSIHQTGKKAKAKVEHARINIAKQFNASANEIYFTSGGSEADNLILFNAVQHLGVKRILSSRIEHHAVLHTIDELEKLYGISVEWIDLDKKGAIHMDHLEELLAGSKSKTLVSLMHVNNEIGNILDIDAVGLLCKKYEALFHSDAVQGVAHYNIDVQKIPIDFFVASAHKFHGPKGVGFAFIKNTHSIHPLLFGGAQERGTRAGTENVHSILGMEKALAIAYANLDADTKKIQATKSYLVNQLKENFSDLSFNGHSEDPDRSSYIILSVRFSKALPMLLLNLDLKGIAASGGSACQSGSDKGSHVLNGFLNSEEATKTSVRFSFNKHNTKQEMDDVIAILKSLIHS